MAMKDAAKRGSQVVVLLFSAAVIARLLSGEWSAITESLAAIRLPPVVAAIPVIWFGMFAAAYTWRMVMAGMGYELTALESFRLFWLFQAASYIPGGVWHFIGIAYWAEDAVPKRVTTAGTAINAAANILVAVALFFAVAPFLLSMDAIGAYLPLLLVVPIGMAALHPAVFYPILNRVLLWAGYDPVDRVLAYSDLLSVFAVKVGGRLLTGAGLYMIIAAVETVPVTLIPAVAGLYAGAWAIGFLVIVMPGGLGVREATGTVFLSAVVAEPVAAVAVLLLRVITLPSEFLFAAGFWLASGQMSRPDVSPA